MTNRTKLIASLLLTLALIALNLVAFNTLLSGWTTARIDLTSDRLYSITDSTEKILSGLEEDVLIYGYFSKRTHLKLSPLVPRIVDLLDEYEALDRVAHEEPQRSRLQPAQGEYPRRARCQAREQMGEALVAVRIREAAHVLSAAVDVKDLVAAQRKVLVRCVAEGAKRDSGGCSREAHPFRPPLQRF